MMENILQLHFTRSDFDQVKGGSWLSSDERASHDHIMHVHKILEFYNILNAPHFLMWKI